MTKPTGTPPSPDEPNLYLIDVDTATLVVDRLQGLLTLADNQLWTVSDSTIFLPLHSALFCMRKQIESLTAILDAGINPDQREGGAPC